MIGAALEGGDLVVVAVVVVVLAFLVYRLVRGSPLVRKMRVGVFVERDPYDDDAAARVAPPASSSSSSDAPTPSTPPPAPWPYGGSTRDPGAEREAGE